MGKPYLEDLSKAGGWQRLRLSGGPAIRRPNSSELASARPSYGWVRRLRETGGVALTKMGGHTGERQSLATTASGCCRGLREISPARPGRRTCRARVEGRLPLSVAVRLCREKLSFNKAWWLARAIVPRWLGDEPSRSDRSGVITMTLPAACLPSLIQCVAGVVTTVVPPVPKTLGTAPVPWMIFRKP